MKLVLFYTKVNTIPIETGLENEWPRNRLSTPGRKRISWSSSKHPRLKWGPLKLLFKSYPELTPRG